MFKNVKSSPSAFFKGFKMGGEGTVVTLHFSKGSDGGGAVKRPC